MNDSHLIDDLHKDMNRLDLLLDFMEDFIANRKFQDSEDNRQEWRSLRSLFEMVIEKVRERLDVAEAARQKQENLFDKQEKLFEN